MRTARISTWRIGLVFSALFTLGSFGCVDAELDRLIDEVVGGLSESSSGSSSPAAGTPVAGGGRGGANIQDGTSNTIGVGERPPPGPGAPADAPVDGARRPADGAARPSDDDDRPTDDAARPSDGAAQPTVGDDAAATVAEFTRALGDKFLTFGSSSFFSSGSITANNELALCAFGRFGMRVTRITSTSLNTFSSESALIGTWEVKAVGGQFVLELTVDNASDPNDIGIQQLVLTVDSNGNLFIDDARADVADATADCAAAQQPQP